MDYMSQIYHLKYICMTYVINLFKRIKIIQLIIGDNLVNYQ